MGTEGQSLVVSKYEHGNRRTEFSGEEMCGKRWDRFLRRERRKMCGKRWDRFLHREGRKMCGKMVGWENVKSEGGKGSGGGRG